MTEYNTSWIMCPSFEHLNEYMSSNTVSTHFNKHHIQYAINLHNLLNENDKSLSLVDLKKKYEHNINTPIYNNLFQIIAHNIFWTSLTNEKHTLTQSETELKQKVLFKIDLITQATKSLFGSGYIWIIYNHNNDEIEIEYTQNAHIPNKCILIGIDVWEHSYYLDYKQNRLQFVLNLINHCINWQIAEIRKQFY